MRIYLYLYTNIDLSQYDPTRILLIGIKTSLIQYPMNPMIRNPNEHAYTIFVYSFLDGLVHFLISLTLSLINDCILFTQNPTGCCSSVRNSGTCILTIFKIIRKEIKDNIIININISYIYKESTVLIMYCTRFFLCAYYIYQL